MSRLQAKFANNQVRVRAYHGSLARVMIAVLIGVPRLLHAAGVVGNGLPSSCTEAALTTALTGGGSVVFNCSSLPIVVPITSTKVIAADTTIDGGGRVTLDGGDATQIFVLTGDAEVTLRNLVIERGKAAPSTVCAAPLTCGGAILVAGSNTLTIDNCELRHNKAPGFGGAIYGGVGTIVIDDSRFIENIADARGGAIDSRGSLTVRTSTFKENRAGTRGGAIAQVGVETASLGISASAFLSNVAASGGALEISGSVLVVNSTFFQNVAFSAAVLGGGAILLSTGDATIFSSTFELNAALSGGQPSNGGAFHVGARGSAIVSNTIIADSLGTDCSRPLTDGGGNLQFPGSTCGSSIRVADPRFDRRGAVNHGGPTETVGLLQGSRALNVGDTSVCLAEPVNDIDQRGVTRLDNSKCDIGAIESSASPPLGCAGDCFIDDNVFIEELVAIVDTATRGLSRCVAGDLDNDGTITINEIRLAVRAGLGNCSPE